MEFQESLNLAVSILGSLGVGAAIVIAASSWLGKVWASRILAKDRERFRERAEKALESIRGDREKGVFVHKVQFETEFAAYREIWKALSEMSAAALRLRPVMDYVPADQTREEIKASRLEAFFLELRRFSEVVRENQPFIDSSLDDPLRKMMKVAHHEAVDYQHDSEKNSGMDEYWNTQKRNREAIEQQAEAVCSLIRERIGLLVVIEDQRS